MTVEAGRTIVCAGAYDSPALLLRSGIGPAADLRALGIPVAADLPGVGANLHDHPAFELPFGGRPSSAAPARSTPRAARSPRSRA